MTVDQACVIGAGSWGTAVAGLVGRHVPTILWARRPELAETVNASGINATYLPGVKMPDSVTATSNLPVAVEGSDVVIMAVPSHGFRDVARQALEVMVGGTPIVSLTKGIEQGSLQRMTEVLAEEMGDAPHPVGVLTGPNLAREVAAGQPAAAVIAMTDLEWADRLQGLVMSPSFRVYTNPDLIGCEAAGALKNVMAIAAGVAHGLGYGDNSKAALLTRALAELTRLGVAMGGKPLTFAGLAGMGDLVATCMSAQSRNRTVGVELGRGRALDDIIAEMNMVAEGVKSTRAVLQLATRHGIEMPIATVAGQILYDGRDPGEAVGALMTRAAKPELHGIG